MKTKMNLSSVTVLMGFLLLAMATAACSEQTSAPALEQQQAALIPGEEAAEAFAAICSPEVGQLMAWQMTVTTSVRATLAMDSTKAGEQGKLQRDDLHTTMVWQVTNVSEGQSHIAVQVTGLEDRGLDGMNTAFMVRMNRDCSFGQFGFAPEVPLDARNQLRGLLQAFQVVVPDVESDDWMAPQADLEGVATVSYRRGNDGTTIRQRSGYHQVFSANRKGGQRQVDILQSNVRFTMANDGLWLDSLDGVEAQRVTLSDSVALVPDTVATLSVRLGLKRDPTTDAIALDGATPWVWTDANEAPTVADNVGTPVSVEAEAALKGIPLESLVPKLDLVVNQPGAAGVREVGNLLIHWLRANPGSPAALVDGMRTNVVPESIRAPAFFGLERAATPEAEVALVTALTATDLGEVDRGRAAAALADSPATSEAGVKALMEVGRDVGADDAGPLQNSALLALGALEANSRQSRPAMAREIFDHVVQRIPQARNDREQKFLFGAIYNSRNPQYLPVIEEAMASERVPTRLNAYRALSGMPQELTGPLFKSVVERETEDAFRARAVEAFVKQVKLSGEPPRPEVLAHALAMLVEGQGQETRKQLVPLIGAAVRAGDAVAKAALVDHAQKERLPSILTDIGRFVSAEELQQ